MNLTPVCPYCRKFSESVTGADVYPHRRDLKDKRFFLCSPCQAWVGTHWDGRPLGTIAKEELRKARSEAHALFDPLWRDRVAFGNRKEAYSWLAVRMGVDERDCHIGMMDEDQCRHVADICAEHGIC